MVAVVVVAVGVTGLWAFAQFGGVGSAAPSTAFSFAYDADDGTLTVQADGGDRIDDRNTDRLAVRVTDDDTGRTTTVNWSDATAGGSLSVTAGSELTVADAGTGTANASVGFVFEAGDTVELLWYGGGRSAPLGEFTVPRDSRSLDAVTSGLNYEYYEADDEYTTLPDFDTMRPTETGTVANVDLSPAAVGDEFAFRFTGYLQVPESGEYTLYTTSDDGSRVYLGGSLVVDNPGLHAARERSGTTNLTAGLVPITVTYFEHEGTEQLDLRWEGPNQSKQRVPDSALYRDNDLDAAFATTCVGLNCTFDAGTTRSPGGSVQEYRWEFGDGTTRTTTTPVVTHRYATNGTFDATLTVLGPTGATDRANRTAAATRLRPPDSPGTTSPGLAYEYFEADDEYTSLPDFDAETSTKSGTVENVNISVRERDSDYAFRFTGYVEVPEDGQYTFYTASDDGSRLYVGDELVVDNPGLHARQERSGTVDLEAGKHRVTVVMFEHTGQEVLDVYWAGPGFDREPIPDANLSHDGSAALAGPTTWAASVDVTSGGGYDLQPSAVVGQTVGADRSPVRHAVRGATSGALVVSPVAAPARRGRN